MMKRLFNEYGYLVRTDNGEYLVLYNRLKNTASGCPRYEFRIIRLTHNKNEWCCAAVYRNNGHYCGDKGECERIVKMYEKELFKDGCL